jgi:hypothetical protein
MEETNEKQEPKYCPQCDEAVESGAKFCGNCGYRLTSVGVDAAQSSQAVGTDELPGENVPSEKAPKSADALKKSEASTQPGKDKLPAYAQLDSVQQKAESQSLTALLLAALSIPGAIISVVGLILAASSLVLATSVRKSVHKKTINSVAIGLGCAGIVLSLASAVFGTVYQSSRTSDTPVLPGDIKQQLNDDQPVDDDTIVTEIATGKVVDAPCYKMMIPVGELKVVDADDTTCNLLARDTQSSEAAKQLLTVDAANNSQITAANLADTAQRIVSRNAGLLLPGYSITAEQSTTFAGSPAYLINTKQTDGESSAQLVVVLHSTTHGENVFIVGYASDKAGADAMQFQKGWEWK